MDMDNGSAQSSFRGSMSPPSSSSGLDPDRLAAMKAGDPQAAANTSGIEVQLVISIALGLAAFLSFCFLRTRWVAMFAPRTKLRRHTPPILSATFFGWVPQLLRMPEAEVLENVGLDAVMMLRFFSMAMKLFAVCLVPGVLIIIPVNYYSTKDGRLPTDPDDDPDLDWTFSFGKPQGTSLLYLFTQFTFTWVFSLLTIYSIWHTYEGYITIRRKYLLKRAKSITSRTVMVHGLPAHLQNDRALATFYESLGVGMVESAHVCRHVRLLKRLIEQRAHALRNLEEVYTKYYGNPSADRDYDPDAIESETDHTLRASDEDSSQEASEDAPLLRPTHKGKPRPTTRLGYLGLFGKKVDKIDHCREVFATLDKAVQKMRMSRIFATSSIGFVTFEEMQSAQILAQTVNTHETLSCQTTLAPEPRDVFWDNLNLPPSELGVRSIVINCTVFLLVFFWAGPVGILSSFLNLESLEKFIPGISKIAEANPLFKSVLQGFLPTLGVVVFLAVVPKILEALCERQGIQSYSAISRSLYNKYFTFILFNVVLVFTVVGTWAQAVDKVYHNVGELALILAISLPRVAPFFVNYTILKGLGLLPLRLLQIGEVFVQSFHGFLSKTPRDYAEARAPPELHYGTAYANATLAFVIILLYSCIKPVILVFGVIYFAMGYLVYKYQFLYVFFHPNESAGQMWPMVYNRATLGVLMFQLTMIGLFMLKQSYVFSVLMAPLPIGTVWFWRWTTIAYSNTAQYIPLELLRPEHPSNLSSSADPATATVQNGVESTTEIQPREHVLVDLGNGGIVNGNGNGVRSVGAATAVVTPGGTKRRIPKSAVDEDDYQAVPDRYTDYRQPPMTLFHGVLNSGLRHYNHPALAGPLPTLWLPLKKSNPEDEESGMNGHHEHSLEAALARPPLKLPSQKSDQPQTFDEGDNLVGGGQDEDLSAPTPAAAGAAGSTSAGTETEEITVVPRGVPAVAAPPASQSQSVLVEVVDSDTDSVCTGGPTPPESPALGVDGQVLNKRNPGVDGIDEIYYHHPERRMSAGQGAPPRGPQGTGSSASLLGKQVDPRA